MPRLSRLPLPPTCDSLSACLQARGDLGARYADRFRYLGDPVDVVTGAETHFETDFRLPEAAIPLSWVRHYDSRRAAIAGSSFGLGFSFCFDVQLRYDVDGITYVDGRGAEIGFPFLEVGETAISEVHRLERLSELRYRVQRPEGAPAYELEFGREPSALARLAAMVPAETGEGKPPSVQFLYDRHGLAAADVGRVGRLVIERTGERISAVFLVGPDGQRKRLVRYEYDRAGRVVVVENAYGHLLRYAYDDGGRLARKTDYRGYSFLFTYDSAGRCVHSRGEDGVAEFRFQYLPLERQTVVTRGDGGVWRYFYDDQNDVVQIVDPYGGLTAFVKDEDGRVVKEVDPRGNETTILYDELGQPYAKRDALGHERRLPADPTPHPLSHRLPESPLEWQQGDWPLPPPAPSPAPAEAQREVKTAPRRLNSRLPTWLEDAWGGDPVPSPPPAPVLVTDVQGLAIREERAVGQVRRWAYDANGNFRWYTDFDGKTRRYEHGSWNHLWRESDPLGSVTEYRYTSSELVASVTDPLGTVHQYEYDKKDRLVAVHRHGRVRERYNYDSAGNLIEKVDGAGKVLLQFVVGRGNLMQRRISAEDVQSFEHTPAGRVAKAENRAGTVTFAYDGNGRRVADERDGRGVRHRFVGSWLAETTVLGKFTTRYIRVDPTTTIVLDPAGQTQRIRVLGAGLFERACSNGVEELSSYDSDGRCLLKVVEGDGLGTGWARKFEYSGEGDLVRRRDTLRGDVVYEHDDGHRLAKVRAGNGGVEEYRYDRAGNLLEAPGLRAGMQAGNRLLDANGERFTYNERDHVAARQGTSGSVRYEYDARDLLTRIEGPGLRYQAVHDGLGRRTQKTVNGRTWHYYWDSDRLAAELFPDGRLRVYVYPDALAWVPLMFIEYDGVEADPASGKRYHLFTDHLGCPELVLDDRGQTVWSARIAPYGTAHVTVGADFHQPLRWPGHYFDAETGLHENRFRTYSPELGRYLQSDPAGVAGGLNLYAYTDNPLRALDLRGLKPKCPKGTKDCPFEKEGGHDSEYPPIENVSPKELRLAASDRTDRKAQRARRKLVREFMRQHGQEYDPVQKKYVKPTARQVADHMKGHDYSKPIIVGPPPPLPDRLSQYQHPEGYKGSYYAHEDASPSSLGIGSDANMKVGDPVVPKVRKDYEVKKDSPYLESTSAPIDDDWSIKEGTPQPADGGSKQYTVPDRSATTLGDPGSSPTSTTGAGS